jgi:uncharacterized protein YkwD
VKAARILFSLLLLGGLAGLTSLVACESSPETEATPADAGQIDGVLDEYATARAEVLSSIAAARNLDLATDRTLDRAAARHALDLAERSESSHIGADGSSPQARLQASGFAGRHAREFLFQIQGEPADLGASAAKSWLAPFEDNGVLTEPATHAGVAFAPTADGGYVGVLILAQR